MIIRREFFGGYHDIDLADELGFNEFLEMTGLSYGKPSDDQIMTLISDIIEASETDFYYINTDDYTCIERYFVAQSEDPLEIWGITTTIDTTGILT